MNCTSAGRCGNWGTELSAVDGDASYLILWIVLHAVVLRHRHLQTTCGTDRFAKEVNADRR